MTTDSFLVLPIETIRRESSASIVYSDYSTEYGAKPKA
ncbi:hypothetical protein BRPE64_ECDS00480 (plasmid) [Caballeronia insecticola]|uniref:Uncharacterized protein n=1 Tax=Caballeronia insecticola TaxID=758793 RepID=R4X4F2_9BURK|nr:hypothetical protein BRPE64_ECDS00480 [Caballeronia insecticola]